MTWILGSGLVFGYGALISDVRATWPNGRHLDVLQKIYPVGPWMMAGFAGSVEFGFKMMADMQWCFGKGREGRIWKPQIAAWRWHRRARRHFAQASEQVRLIPSSLLLVGVSPFNNGSSPWRLTRCVRMQSAAFVPEFARPLSWLSIGRGATHQIAEDFANQTLSRFARGPAMAESGNPGGAAMALAGVLATMLEDSPVDTVSDQLQVGSVWPGRHRIAVLRVTRYEEDGPITRPLPALATSWDEFQRIASDAGLSATAAAA